MLPKRIIAIGASSVFGRIDPSGGGFIGRLKAWHEMQEPNYNAVFNLGISGDNTNGMLTRLIPEAKVRNPDLIIFSLGSNDASRKGSVHSSNNTSINDFKNNVVGLIKKGKSISKDKNLVFVSAYPINDVLTMPLMQTSSYYLMKDLIVYTGETEAICKDNNVPYLNIFDMFIKEDYKKFLYQDGLHCNTLGHKKIFDELKKFLLDLYK